MEKRSIDKISVLLTLLSETLISIVQVPDHLFEAPKKYAFYICRIQQTLLEELCEEWSLEGSSMFGAWGYIFKYKTGELYLYQQDREEKLTPLSDTFPVM